jgi:signal transduction histidine kinase
MLYLAVLVGPVSAPGGIIRLAVPLTEVESQINELKYALGIAFGAAFLVSVALSIFLARGLTGPFSEMVAVARRLAEGQLGERIRVVSRDELGVLATTLNRMAEQLQRLEHVRRDFVANVSHELRTPLTSIKGYVEALLDSAKDDPQESRQFLEIILKQSDRLNLILDDLLQLSQIESREVVFKRDAVRLGEVVERTLSLIRPLAEKKGHTLKVTVPDGLPAVGGDEGRLVQVLTNLLDNAVKYTPPRGTITIGAQVAAADMVDLSVSDTGPGIPEADRPRVFERFYRVDKARSRELGGTGLGLAIVKHIVEGHGGHVWVEGNRPTGSRFVVRLPAARPVETHAKRERPTESPT